MQSLRHGYAYLHYRDARHASGRPAAWGKVAAMREALEDGRWDWVVWVDCATWIEGSGPPSTDWDHGHPWHTAITSGWLYGSFHVSRLFDMLDIGPVSEKRCHVPELREMPGWVLMGGVWWDIYLY